MFEALFLVVLAILIGGPVLFFLYCFAVYALQILCSWLLKLLFRPLNDTDNHKYSMIIANIILILVMYIYLLYPVVDELLKSRDTLAAVFIILGFVLFAIVHFLFNAHRQNDTLYNTIHTLKTNIASLEAEKKDLEDKLSKPQERYCATPFVMEINRLEAEVSSLKEQLKECNSLIEKQAAEIEMPADIYFINGNVPVKGKISDLRPFGDFTVYVAERGKCYHSDYYCGTGLYRAKHIYEVLGKKSPCQKCAVSPYSEVPKWYIVLKRQGQKY